jgi:hypothetical protein
VTAVLVFGASIAAFGLEPWRHYLTDTSALEIQALRDLQGFFPVMMVSILAEARAMGLSFELASALQIAASLPVAVAAAWAVRRTRDPRQRVFVLASAAPLITPYAFNYDLTALSAVLLWRLTDATEPSSAKDLVFRLGWFLPIVAMSLNMIGLGIAPMILLAIFILAVADTAGAPAGETGRAAPAAALG